MSYDGIAEQLPSRPNPLDHHNWPRHHPTGNAESSLTHPWQTNMVSNMCRLHAYKISSTPSYNLSSILNNPRFSISQLKEEGKWFDRAIRDIESVFQKLQPDEACNQTDDRKCGDRIKLNGGDALERCSAWCVHAILISKNKTFIIEETSPREIVAYLPSTTATPNNGD